MADEDTIAQEPYYPPPDVWRRYGLEPPADQAAIAPPTPATVTDAQISGGAEQRQSAALDAPENPGRTWNEGHWWGGAGYDLSPDEQAAVAARIADPNNPQLNYFGRASRDAFFGVMDFAEAALPNEVHRRLQQMGYNDLSYDQVRRIITDVHDREDTLASQIGGALVTSVPIVRGVQAAGRTAMTVGQWASRIAGREAAVDGVIRAVANPSSRLGRVVSATTRYAGEGAATGAVYEAVRASVSQVVHNAPGEDFDTDEVTDAALQGAMVGAIAAPVVAAGIRSGTELMGAVANIGGSGLRTIGDWTAATLGSDNAASRMAGRRIERILSRYYDEPGEAVALRMQMDVANFRAANNGRTPTLAEILPRDIMNDITSEVRRFSGLGQRATTRAEAVMDEVQGNLLRAVENRAGSGRIITPREMDELANVRFDRLMSQHGDTLVEVPDAVIEGLAPHVDWLTRMATGGNMSAAASRMSRVITARQTVQEASQRAQRAATATDVASMRAEAASLRADLANLIMDARQGGGVPQSEEAYLATMARYLDTMATHISRSADARYATQTQQALQNDFAGLQAVLDDYAANGLRVTLRDANTLRAMSSRISWSLRSSNPLEANTFRGINAQLSRVGAEVPEYAATVENFAAARTAAENQWIGRQAVSHDPRPNDLRAALRGQTDEGRVTGERLQAVQEGAEHGLFGEAEAALSGTRQQAGNFLIRVRDSQAVQEGIDSVLERAGPNAEQIAAQLGMGADSLERLAILADYRFNSTMADDAGIANIVSGLVFSGRAGGGTLAGLTTTLMTRFNLTRSGARSLIDKLTDPNGVADAVRFMDRRGISRDGFIGTLLGVAGRAVSAGRFAASRSAGPAGAVAAMDDARSRDRVAAQQERMRSAAVRN